MASQAAQSPPPTNAPAWLTQPLSVTECLNLALVQNSAILKSQKDLEAVHGVVVQMRAIAIPKVQAAGDYRLIDQESIDKFPVPQSQFPIAYPDQRWSSQIQLVQSIYEGGRLTSSLRAAKLTQEQALLNHQAVVEDTLLEVRVAYADILMAAQQIVVQEASVKLLTQELEDTTRRFEAGTVPRFNVLRAKVEIANARPRLSRARNAHRIGKHNLANLLGYHVPAEIGEDIPLQLTGKLQADPYDIELPAAIMQALERRPELDALRKAERLRKEGIVMAKSGYKPSFQVLTGYGSRSSSFHTDPGWAVYGWFAGAQVSWNIFDGRLTKGKVEEARAQYEKAQVNLDDTSRRIELEVRTAYSNFIEAREVLEAQKMVQEQAEEALRLAAARYEAGSGTQLDVLSAQTSLTEARTTQIQGLHDYSVARARLERAIGQNVMQQTSAK